MPTSTVSIDSHDKESARKFWLESNLIVAQVDSSSADNYTASNPSPYLLSSDALDCFFQNDAQTRAHVIAQQ